jgi:uncharacterized membrane-anchored protein YitT (DUF2179 family)
MPGQPFSKNHYFQQKRLTSQVGFIDKQSLIRLMKKRLFPAIAIVAVTIVLLVFNHFTKSTIIKDYAFLFIIAGMLLGYGLGKRKG